MLSRRSCTNGWDWNSRKKKETPRTGRFLFLRQLLPHSLYGAALAFDLLDDDAIIEL